MICKDQIQGLASGRMDSYSVVLKGKEVREGVYVGFMLSDKNTESSLLVSIFFPPWEIGGKLRGRYRAWKV